MRLHGWRCMVRSGEFFSRESFALSFHKMAERRRFAGANRLGISVISDYEPFQAVALCVCEQKLTKYSEHKAPIVKQLSMPLIWCQNVASAPSSKCTTKVTQYLGTLGFIFSWRFGELNILQVGFEVR